MVTFAFYRDNNGQLDEVSFNTQARQAVNYINYVTFDRLKGYEDTDNRLKFLLCDMVDMQAKSDRPEISSHSTGAASVSYNVTAATTLEQKQFKLSHMVLSRTFVNGVRSNYRG